MGASAPGPQPYRGGVNSSPWGRLLSLFFHPFPVSSTSSLFWILAGSSQMLKLWNAAFMALHSGSRTELRCQDSHRNLDSKLLLDGDTWENVGGKRYLMTENQDGPLNSAPQYSWGNCVSLIKTFFSAQGKPDHPQCRVEGS